MLQAFFLCLGVYAVLWFNYSHRRILNEAAWRTDFPTIVPLATAALVLSFSSLVLAVWPVWFIASPIVVFPIFFAFLMLLQMFI
jgi:hypothetical protein